MDFLTGRTVFVLAAICVLIFSVVTYLRKEDSNIVVQRLADMPKIELLQFEYFRVKDDVVTARIIGKQGRLMDGGVVQLRKGFRAVKYKDEVREELVADAADAHLSQSSLGKFTQELKTKEVRVFGKVNLQSSDRRLETEEATYTEADQMIRSSVLTTLLQKGQNLTADKGFELSREKETIRMFGAVSGLVLPKSFDQAEKKANNGSNARKGDAR